MKVTSQKKIEDCIDGSQIYQYVFDVPWTRSLIFTFQGLGKLEYYADFPRPFFRVLAERGLQIKGVEGEMDCRIFFPRGGREELEAKINRHFSSLEAAAL